jgi:hypothetical protein
MPKNYNEKCQELLLDTLQKLQEAPMDRKEVSSIKVSFDALPDSLGEGYTYLPKISITFKE